MKNKPILGLVLFIAVVVIYGIVFAQTLNLSGPAVPSDDSDITVPPTSTSTPDEIPIATSTPPDSTSTVTLDLNKKKTIDTVALTTTAVIEDSRCPRDVQCVWAGRVVISVQGISSKGRVSKSLTIGESITLDSFIFTLQSVMPSPTSGKKTTDAEYRFTFGVEKKTPPTSVTVGGCYVGGCSGQICSSEKGAVSTCEYRQVYACYKTATCERQKTGQCGWTETATLKKCVVDADTLPLEPTIN